MTESELLLEAMTAEVRTRLGDRRWYRRQRDLAIGRARTWEAAMEHASEWGVLGKENDAVLRVLVRLLGRARRAAAHTDGLTESKRRAVERLVTAWDVDPELEDAPVFDREGLPEFNGAFR